MRRLRTFRPRAKKFELILTMLLFSVLGATFLLLIGEDALAERHPFQFFADSNTYLQTYRGEANNFEGQLIGVDSNYLGPLTVLRLLQGNIYLVLLLNVYMFTHAILHISKLLAIDPLRLALLLFLSPLTVSSLLSVNKEIFLFPFLAFALTGYLRRAWSCVILALASSLLVRWQLTGFYLLLLALASGRRLIPSRFAIVAILLVAISILYGLIQPLIEPILAYVQNSIDTFEGDGSGLFESVLTLQNQGLYFLIFPLKAFHLLFGMGFKLDKIFNPVEVYNDLFVSGHCAIAFLVFLTLAWRRKLSLRSDWVFLALVFLAVFCLTPVFAPRYLYFVFLLGALMLAGAPPDLRRIRLRKFRPYRGRLPVRPVTTASSRASINYSEGPATP